MHAATFEEGYVCTSNTHQRGADGGVRCGGQEQRKQALVPAAAEGRRRQQELQHLKHMLRLVPPDTRTTQKMMACDL